MDRNAQLAALTTHQSAALDLLARGTATLGQGQSVTLDKSADLRREMAEVLGAYQVFKHNGIFDPAISSGDDERAKLAKEMKVHCIAASEVFRAHMKQWTPARIVEEWDQYEASARQAIDGLSRHITAERVGIAELINRYGG
jgi:hypothetical protein